MESMDLAMLILYLVLQIIIGGLIFNGFKRLYEIFIKKQKTGKINLAFLMVGIIGLCYFLVINTLRLIDNY